MWTTSKICVNVGVFVFLAVISQGHCEGIAVNKEALQEEHLLPVRTARATHFEGSGDEDDVMPISSLKSGVMERMTLKAEESELDENKIVSDDEKEELEPEEVVEEIDEGSGSDEPKPVASTDSEESAEGNATTVLPESTTEEVGTTTLVGRTETTTAEAETETSTPATTEAITQVTEVITELNLREETSTALETTTQRTEETTTIAPEVGITEEATTENVETTVSEKEPEAVTEARPVEVTEKTAAPEEETTTEITATSEGGNVTFLENENLTAGMDTLLMKENSRLLDAKETVLLSSKDPSRLGTYIVVSLILLSFLSLIGFILMKRRVQKRRKQGNTDPENLETEKALLSLSEYKDHPDDEGKIKNNEITPIVIKSNSQINKFEKNTNFSSPKNINTKANEKNIEKDNVLKDNLTQVIIEDTKDLEEDKTPEKLIVRTHLDQDSIPKKPVLVNRTSLGCVPVSQD